MHRLYLFLALGLGLQTIALASNLEVSKSNSRIEVAVKATVDSFVGVLSDYDLKLEQDAATQLPGQARLSFHFSDLKTGKDGRDTKMLSWIGKDKTPDGTFELQTLRPLSGSSWQAHGRVTLHGITKDIDFPVSITRDEKGCAIDGEALLVTTDYGLPIIRMMGVLTVQPQVKVRFHIQAALVGNKS